MSLCPALATYAGASSRSAAPRRSPRRCRWWRRRRCARPSRPRWPTRPFGQLLYRIQREATTQAVDFTHPLLEVREVRKRAVILIGTDKGLCGALNSNLFRVAAQFDPATTVYITAGQRAAQFVARTGRQLGRGVHLRGHAAIRRSQGDCGLCPRPVLEGGGGPGPDRLHAFHQHADPAARLPLSFCRSARSKG